jgi:diguanylate cyclase (GGDEF)-like protein
MQVPLSGEARPGVFSLKVLIADDDEGFLGVVSTAVLSLGHSCRVAADGLQALHLHQSDPAHVILCDWRMPRMNGVDLCRRTRESNGGAYTHFIMVSAVAGKQNFLEAMRAGADAYLYKPLDLEELAARLEAACRVAALQDGLVTRTRRLERDSERLRVVARTDHLTLASNRLRLEEDLEAVRDRVLRYNHRYCAVLCDIDWFKGYNDRFGHLAGDAAIRLVSRTIQGQLRRGDGFYRYGGEEFLCLLPEQKLWGAKECMERVRAAVAALPDAAHGGALAGPLTISVGIAEFRATTTEDAISSWLQRADFALYRAKNEGRNRVEADQ